MERLSATRGVTLQRYDSGAVSVRRLFVTGMVGKLSWHPLDSTDNWDVLDWAECILDVRLYDVLQCVYLSVSSLLRWKIVPFLIHAYKFFQEVCRICKCCQRNVSVSYSCSFSFVYSSDVRHSELPFKDFCHLFLVDLRR